MRNERIRAKEHKFKVGDRVVYRANVYGDGWLSGMEGTVIYVDNTCCPYTVEFDVPLADGVTDNRAITEDFKPRMWHGRFCREENLEPARKRRTKK